ncbi:hypothetical protein [Streptomyces phytophilus]|uniref:hypothetical protein n=1 Tax=Streptomyces phytophilus TaxID=722715 RepID=UPI0015F0AA29|nr:hypothetical protein [Streptomyces phytophilus]
MQPLPGADLPHAHPRAVHWIATAAAMAAVVALAALIQPPTVAAGNDGKSDHGGRPAPGPNPGAAHYPVDCAGTEPEVFKHGSADFDADGRAETVAVVRCRAAAGSPPSGMYVVSATKPGVSPRVTETLLDPAEGMSVGEFAVRENEISATLLGYSSPDQPRSKPDKQRNVTWKWEDGRFRLTAEPVPGTQV